LDEEGMKCERRKRKRRYNERRRQKMENGNGTNEGPAQNMCKANGTHDHEGIEMRRIESPTSMASGDYASRPMMNHPVSSQKRRGRISRTSRPEDGTPVVLLLAMSSSSCNVAVVAILLFAGEVVELVDGTDEVFATVFVASAGDSLSGGIAAPSDVEVAIELGVEDAVRDMVAGSLRREA
jgi:hypothetical protein